MVYHESKENAPAGLLLVDEFSHDFHNSSGYALQSPVPFLLILKVVVDPNCRWDNWWSNLGPTNLSNQNIDWSDLPKKYVDKNVNEHLMIESWLSFALCNPRPPCFNIEMCGNSGSPRCWTKYVRTGFNIKKGGGGVAGKSGFNIEKRGWMGVLAGHARIRPTTVGRK